MKIRIKQFGIIVVFLLAMIIFAGFSATCPKSALADEATLFGNGSIQVVPLDQEEIDEGENYIRLKPAILVDDGYASKIGRYETIEDVEITIDLSRYRKKVERIWTLCFGLSQNNSGYKNYTVSNRESLFGERVFSGRFGATIIRNGHYYILYFANGAIFPEEREEKHYIYSYIKETIITSYELIGGHVVEKPGTIESTIKHFSDKSIMFSPVEKTVEAYIASLGNASVSSSQRLQLRNVAGLPAGDSFPVYVKYKVMEDFQTPKEETIVYQTSSLLAWDKDRIIESVYARGDFSNIADFNAVYRDIRVLEDGELHTLSDKIILQAQDLEYIYNPKNGTGTLTVAYAPYQYSSFAIKVRNNTGDELTVFVYTSNVIVGSTQTEMRFVFSEIMEQISSNTNWVFDWEDGDFIITNNSNGKVSVNVLSDCIQVLFNNTDESELAHVSITAVASIIPDHTVYVTNIYKKLSFDTGGNIVVTDVVSAGYSMSYKLFLGFNSTIFKNRFLSEITEHLIYPNGHAYYEYDGISITNNTYNPEQPARYVTITVNYKYNLIFKIINVAGGYEWFSPTRESGIYYGRDFGITVPENNRISYITTSSDYIDKIINTENALESRFDLVGPRNQPVIIEFYYKFTDEFYMNVNYLERYKETPFAVLRSWKGTVKYNDVEDLRALIDDEFGSGVGAAKIARILNRETMNVLGSHARIKRVDFDENSLQYTVTLDYSYKILIQTDYYGNKKEIRIPLGPYSAWTSTFESELYGQALKGWSILSLLDADGKAYFRYSDEVDPEKLYGYFTAVSYDEKISDLQYLFRHTNGAGRVITYNTQEIKGSDFYRLMNAINNSPFVIITWPGTLTSQMIAELANNENKIVYTRYIFLDLTVETAFDGENNPQSPNDTGSAAQNFFRDVGKKISGLWDNITSNKKLTFVFWSVVGVLAYAFVFWLLSKTGIFANKVVMIAFSVISVILAVIVIWQGFIAFGLL